MGRGQREGAPPDAQGGVLTTDYRLAACAGHDPDWWDGAGTSRAHLICTTVCTIRAGCAADARAEDTHGVMRGGVVFPDYGKGKRVSRRTDDADLRAIRCWVLRQQGLGLTAIGQRVHQHHTTVIKAVQRVEAAPALLQEARRQLREYAA